MESSQNSGRSPSTDRADHPSESESLWTATSIMTRGTRSNRPTQPKGTLEPRQITASDRRPVPQRSTQQPSTPKSSRSTPIPEKQTVAKSKVSEASRGPSRVTTPAQRDPQPTEKDRTTAVPAAETRDQQKQPQEARASTQPPPEPTQKKDQAPQPSGDESRPRKGERKRTVPREDDFVGALTSKKGKKERTPRRPSRSAERNGHSEKKKTKRTVHKKRGRSKRRNKAEKKKEKTARTKEKKTRRERPMSSSSDTSRSKVTVTLSSSDDEDSDRENRKEMFLKELRKTTEGRDRFEDFTRNDYRKAVDLFWTAGYYRVESLRQMHDNARTFFVNNLRKMTGGTGVIKDTKLVLDIIEIFQTRMKNSKDPKIEEIQIPIKMKKWCPALSDLSGVLIPDQDMVNFFTIEMTRGQNEVPPYHPFVTGQLHENPWTPADPSFVRAHSNWKKLQETHKRPNGQLMAFQAFVLSYLRFVLAGDLAGAWTHFGGLCAQMTHLGTLLTIATIDNAMIAMAYDRALRTSIEVQARRRINEEQRAKLIEMLTNEHDVTKKAVLREATAGSTTEITNKGTKKPTQKGEPSRRNGKNIGNKAKTGKQKGKQWDQRQQWDNWSRPNKGSKGKTQNIWQSNNRGKNNWNEVSMTETARKQNEDRPQPTATPAV